MCDTNIVFSEERKQITKRRQPLWEPSFGPALEQMSWRCLASARHLKGQVWEESSFGKRPWKTNKLGSRWSRCKATLIGSHFCFYPPLFFPILTYFKPQSYPHEMWKTSRTFSCNLSINALYYYCLQWRAQANHKRRQTAISTELRPGAESKSTWRWLASASHLKGQVSLTVRFGNLLRWQNFGVPLESLKSNFDWTPFLFYSYLSHL